MYNPYSGQGNNQQANASGAYPGQQPSHGYTSAPQFNTVQPSQNFQQPIAIHESIPAMANASEVPVAEPLPGNVYAQAIPEAQLISKYEGMGINVTEYTSNPEYKGGRGEVPPQGTFFSEAEIVSLQAQPIPVAVDFDKISDGMAAPPPPSGNQQASIVLEPAEAMPVMINAFSMARVQRDSLHRGGIKSTDPILNSHEEIIKFFNQYNSRPIMYLSIEGYHHETHTYTDRNADGTTTTRTETRRVTDFSYRVDLTQFIFPYGKITVSAGSSKSINDMITDYLGSTNKLKSLQMQKKVFWDKLSLCYLVRAYIRRLGWHRELDVFCRLTDASVRVCTESKMAACYDNCCCRVLMIVTIIPAIVFAIYGSGDRERGMRSIFSITLSPLMVFEYIRPQLWCPGYRGCRIH